MSNNTPGSSNAAQLLPNPKLLKLELCLICQTVKDSAGSSKLGQNRLVDRRYHIKSCYATYKTKVARHKVETLKQKPDEPDLSPLTPPVI